MSKPLKKIESLHVSVCLVAGHGTRQIAIIMKISKSSVIRAKKPMKTRIYSHICCIWWLSVLNRTVMVEFIEKTKN